MRFDHQFFKAVIPDVSFFGGPITDIANFTVDSRTTGKGEAFFALKGNRVDGHDFIQQAIDQGAIGLVIDKDRQKLIDTIDPQKLKSLWIAVVPDATTALIKLATAWRSQFRYPVIGITGSIGKTSTKEILSHILKLNGNHFIASHSNQNTAIGISLNILRMKDDHTMALFEMGISKRGEMARMAEIVRPTMAIITTIGHSHMEGLGSLQDIAIEKREILKFFKDDNIAIINGDVPLLAAISYKHPIVKFGLKTINQVQARKLQVGPEGLSCTIKLYKDRYPLTFYTQHTGLLYNILAAATVAHLLGVPHDMIIKGITTPPQVNGRFANSYLPHYKSTIIDDCYNASPESMKAALFALETMQTNGPKIAVLGDMLELGINSPFWHRQLGRVLRKAPSLTHIILVGEMTKWTVKTLPVTLSYEQVTNWQEATECLKKRLVDNCLILVKGSRGIGLNNLVAALTQSKSL